MGASTRTAGCRVVTAIPTPIPEAEVNSGWANGPITPRRKNIRQIAGLQRLR